MGHLPPEYTVFIAARLRRVWCEGTFAVMKDRRGLRRAMRRGLERVAEQVLVTAAAVNLKRLVSALLNLPGYLSQWPLPALT
ncbi:MAG: transposase [Bacillota bacterium]